MVDYDIVPDGIEVVESDEGGTFQINAPGNSTDGKLREAPTSLAGIDLLSFMRCSQPLQGPSTASSPDSSGGSTFSFDPESPTASPQGFPPLVEPLTSKDNLSLWQAEDSTLDNSSLGSRIITEAQPVSMWTDSPRPFETGWQDFSASKATELVSDHVDHELDLPSSLRSGVTSSSLETFAQVLTPTEDSSNDSRTDISDMSDGKDVSEQRTCSHDLFYGILTFGNKVLRLVAKELFRMRADTGNQSN
ncbi:hypothetical protein EJ08DRAFT_691995 [Tothia fuscella]|uniref:Uncharacterized protein n=1 Tax=Tothia fuscella TaxID=1048955 RepID=A0A9P4P3S3_9PEZI|nr:hypothetical protein EJ08DRAFT_691995 [Tothia fuscella]